MALNLDELMIGDIILNDEGKPCVIEGLYRNQVYTNKGVYLPFEVDPMPVTSEFLVNNHFSKCRGIQCDHFVFGDLDRDGYIKIVHERYSFDGPSWSAYIRKRGHPNIGIGNLEFLSIHTLQHAIKQANIKLTLTCQQSS